MSKNCILLVVFLVVGTIQGQEKQIDSVLNAWHQAAANAYFDTYFGLMTPDAVFIGTDATENWDLPAFKAYAKPYFDKGKAWSFKSVQRHIYLDATKELAWFDELLSTQMKLCRGSGVLRRVNGTWKVAHYVLSIAVPNAQVGALINLKKENDSLLLRQLKSQ